MIMRRNRPHIPRDYMYQPYGPRHPVARAIADGDRWFWAWAFQYALNGPRLKKMTGITPDRANELHHGAPVSHAEVEALAKACGVQPADIIASIPGSAETLKTGMAVDEKTYGDTTPGRSR